MKLKNTLMLFQSHPRLCISIGIGLAVPFLAAIMGWGTQLTRTIGGYDIGASVYIVWAFFLMYRSNSQEMRQRALAQDDGKYAVLILVILALFFSTCAIFADLASAKHIENAQIHQSLYLAITTIIVSWLLMNVVFALHYAHDYYFDSQQGLSGGLVFLPASEEPAYLDFVYFSFILGATAQTADVALCSQKMRRTCTLHSVLAFFFNTTLLALAVNKAARLI